MEQITVLLIDLFLGSPLGKATRRILCEPSGQDLRVLEKPPGKGTGSFSDDEVLDQIPHVRPKVVVLVVAAGSGTQARRILRRLGKEWAGLPLIVVTEGGRENEISDLLALGAIGYCMGGSNPAPCTGEV